MSKDFEGKGFTNDLSTLEVQPKSVETSVNVIKHVSTLPIAYTEMKCICLSEPSRFTKYIKGIDP